MTGVIANSEPVGKNEIEKIRSKLETGFKKLAAFISAVRAPLPTETGDGTYLHYENDDPTIWDTIKADLKDLGHLGITDIKTLIEIQEKAKTHSETDDRTYIMEKLIQAATKFPDDSKNGKDVTSGFLAVLYNDLQHPPQSYVRLGPHASSSNSD
jgi:linoleate 8R-lipoxygenase / 9,12-octadecadienoate 8-hydroperoxide 8R-isomerase